MPIVPRRHHVSRHHPVPRPVELIPSPEPAPFKLYEGPVRRGPAPKPAKPIKPVMHPDVASWMEMESRRNKTRAAEELLPQEEVSRRNKARAAEEWRMRQVQARWLREIAPKLAKPVKPVVHPSVVSWMEECARQSKIRGAEERLRQEEARRLREKAYTENVYTELHLMELINEHTGNK